MITENPPITEIERKQNLKKMVLAIESTGLNFHTLQLAVIDMCRSSLLYHHKSLPLDEQNASRSRVDNLSEKFADLLNSETKSPGEDMLLLYALLDQAVQLGMIMKQNGVDSPQ